MDESGKDGVFQKERIIVVKPGDTIELKKDMKIPYSRNHLTVLVW